MGKRLGALVLAVLAVSMLSVAGAARADTFLACAVRQVAVADAPRFDSTVGCRVWQVTGPVTTINANTGGINPACLNQRCLRTFATNALFGGAGFGGYLCNQESTGAYGPPASEPSNQTFYCLIDAQADTGTCGHAGFYYVSGQSANNNTTDNAGDARASNCAGTVAQNCFTAGDAANSDQTPLTSTMATFGAVPHQIRASGGFSPVPTVRVTSPGSAGCGSNQVRLTWDDPISVIPTLKNGVPSPVLGVNLYRNDSSCGTCPSDTDAAWTRASSANAPNGEYGTNSGSVGDCLAIAPGGNSWFALTIRLRGPGNLDPTPIESYIGANSQCAAIEGTASRIVAFGARYAGRGTVNVHWASGSEGGVQGYYVMRATSPTGPFTRVSDFMGVTGDNSRYTFSDHIRTSMGRLIAYQLEIVHGDGTSEHSGTTSVTVPGPKVKKLGVE